MSRGAKPDRGEQNPACPSLLESSPSRLRLADSLQGLAARSQHGAGDKTAHERARDVEACGGPTLANKERAFIKTPQFSNRPAEVEEANARRRQNREIALLVQCSGRVLCLPRSHRTSLTSKPINYARASGGL